MVKRFLIIGAALALVFCTVRSNADTWYEQGEAGQLLNVAQDTLGISASLSRIQGSLENCEDVDLYRICILDPSAFSASTLNTLTYLPDTTLFDTQLFLFDENGLGVVTNDDASSTGHYFSLIPSGTPYVTSPGFYYLGVSSAFNSPESGGARIFKNWLDDADWDPTGIYGRNSGSSTLTSWTGGGNAEGTYSIELTGAKFAAIPEAETMRLMGMLLVLGAGSLYRQRRAQRSRS